MKRICSMTCKKLFALLLCIGLLSGCAALPDIAPFVAATSAMSSSVISGGATVETELRLMGDTNRADQFAEEWKARVNAMNAMVTYSNGLNSIVKAGRTGSTAVGSLADSLTGLATSAGVTLPAAATLSVATDAAKLIYAQIALVRASSALQEAVTNTQPAIDQIAGIIATDLKDASEIFLIANSDLQDELKINEQ